MRGSATAMCQYVRGQAWQEGGRRKGCRLRTKENVTVEELAMLMRREESNFCMSYLCDDVYSDWILSLDICECRGEDEEEVDLCILEQI